MITAGKNLFIRITMHMIAQIIPTINMADENFALYCTNPVL